MLKKMCKDQGLYTTPSINDKLYLHYKGFKSICNLEEYVGLKALWLEGNGLGKIEGLEALKDLRTLYLHENIIEKIEGMDNQLEMDNINLSKNFIRKVENLSHMKKLTSLNLASNSISTLEGITQLLEIPTLQTVDLQQNKIEDPAIVDIFAQLPDLRVLYLMGNPAVKHIRNYRKTIISRCKMLKYLDDRPVFDDERRRTEAWYRVIEAGGTNEEAMEAERDELKAIRREKDEADERNFRAFEQLMREGQEIRRLRELEQLAESGAAAAGAVGIEVAANSSTAGGVGASAGVEESKGGLSVEEIVEVVEDVNPFTGEKIIPVPESEELRIAREARWGASSVPFSVRYEEQLRGAGYQAGQPQKAPQTTSAPAQREISTESAADNADVDTSSAMRLEIEEVMEVVEESNTDLWKDVYAKSGVATGSAGNNDENATHVAAKSSKFMSMLSQASQEVAQAAVPVNVVSAAAVDMEELD